MMLVGKNSLKLHSDPIKSITLNTMTRFKSEVNAWVGRRGRSSPVQGLNFDISPGNYNIKDQKMISDLENTI